MSQQQAQTHAGGCACGQIRFRMESDPMIVHCCHCRWCQRETGSAFALNAMIETSRVSILDGLPESVTLPSESGKGQEVLRCPECRTALWSHYGGAGKLVAFVRVGTLENPDLCPPDVHIFTCSKQPWVRLPEGTKLFEHYYRLSETWPDSSIARRKALLESVEAPN